LPVGCKLASGVRQRDPLPEPAVDGHRLAVRVRRAVEATRRARPQIDRDRIAGQPDADGEIGDRVEMHDRGRIGGVARRAAAGRATGAAAGVGRFGPAGR